MNVIENISLAKYSTMGLGGTAAFLVEITDRKQVTEAVNFAKSKQIPIIMIGGGSNIIWNDSGFEGLVIVNKIMGYDQQAIDEINYYLTIGSGENWDQVVRRSVEAGLTGIEALSLIPGTTGATPIQNVGAYGQEIAQSLTTIEAYDTQTDQFITIPGSDCQFSYRNSRFKSADKGRFLITSITLQLTKQNPLPPYYGSVQTYFEANKVTEITPQKLREAVIAIRSAKLPDPTIIKNTGSFFANPIVTQGQFDHINTGDVAIPNWSADDGKIKLSAAWLIEQAGYKNFHDSETGMATWPQQALVLINEHAGSTADLLVFKQKIVSAVHTKFGVELIQEPELLP